MANENDWDGDGIPNDVDLTPGNPPEERPLSMPEDSEPKKDNRPTLSLEKDYPSEDDSGATSIDAKKVVNPYIVDSYVPIPRPVSDRTLITTGSKTLSVPIAVDTSSMRGLKIASDLNSILYNDRYSKSDAEALWDQLPTETQNTLTEIAQAQGGRSGKALWERSVASSYLSTKQGAPRTPWQFIEEGIEKLSSSPTGPRGPGAYSGPSEAVVVQAESDIRSLADDIAIEILGRGATDAELQKITNRIRKAEMAQPQVTTTQPGRTVTEQGLTATGREDILREVLSKNPEFEQYQLDTTVMDAMTRFVNKKKAVAGD